MGGQGSGRKPKPNPVKEFYGEHKLNPSVSSDLVIPNLSGVKHEIKKGSSEISTDDLAEGSTNLYLQSHDNTYHSENYITDLTGFDTGDLSEGTNLYYTDARAVSAIATEDAYVKNTTDSMTGSLTLGGDLDIAGTKLESGTNNILNITTDNGTLDIGPRNSSYCHMLTDRDNFYFDKPIVTGGNQISSYSTNDLKFYTNTLGTEVLRLIDSNSEVRVTTGNLTVPNGDLELDGNITAKDNGFIAVSTSPQIRMYKTNASDDPNDFGWILYSDNNLRFLWRDDSTSTTHENLRIEGDTGNVGIGTTTPSAKLEVDGTAKVTGTMGFYGDVNIFSDTLTTTGDINQVNGNFKTTGQTQLGEDSNNTSFATDGLMIMTGTARVEKCISINPKGFKAPGTNPADEEDLGIGSCWAFDDGVQQYVTTEIDIPKDMDTSVAPKLRCHWSANATSEDAVWQLEYLYRSEDEDMTASAQETLTETATSSSTANGLVETEMTGIDTPSSSDKVMLIRISRKTGDANDTLTGDVHLTDIQLCYTSNKLGEAT